MLAWHAWMCSIHRAVAPGQSTSTAGPAPLSEPATHDFHHRSLLRQRVQPDPARSSAGCALTARPSPAMYPPGIYQQLPGVPKAMDATDWKPRRSGAAWQQGQLAGQSSAPPRSCAAAAAKYAQPLLAAATQVARPLAALLGRLLARGHCRLLSRLWHALRRIQVRVHTLRMRAHSAAGSGGHTDSAADRRIEPAGQPRAPARLCCATRRRRGAHTTPRSPHARAAGTRQRC